MFTPAGPRRPPYQAHLYLPEPPDQFLIDFFEGLEFSNTVYPHSRLPMSVASVPKSDLLVVDVEDKLAIPVVIGGISKPALTHFLDVAALSSPSVLLISDNPAFKTQAYEHGVGVLDKPVFQEDLLRRALALAPRGRLRRYFSGRVRDSKREKRPVFLSFQEHDQDRARALCSLLESEGIPVWFSKSTLHPGDMWKDRIAGGIEDALILICVVSGNYLANGHPMSEYKKYWTKHARGQRLPPDRLILPACLESGLMPDRNTAHLLGLQGIDLEGPGWVPGVEELCRCVRDHLRENGWEPEFGFVED